MLDKNELARRIRRPELLERIMTPRQAADRLADGMVVGMSGFTKAGDAKAVPLAMAERAATDPFRITLITGASLGHDVDRILTEAGILARRMPFQADATLRAAINRGEVMFIDQHLSETVEHIRSGQLGPLDYAIVEAAAITELGGIVPTTSVGNSASFSVLAKKIIVEINLSQPLELEGLHDVYFPSKRPTRSPIPIVSCESRIGFPYVSIDPDKIEAIVITHTEDSASSVEPPDADTAAIAGRLIAFLEGEVAKGRLDMTLQPLQAGIGSIANAVLAGLADGPFHHLKMYSEVLQDSTFDLFDAGKLVFASASSITLGAACAARVFPRLAQYKDRLVLRPQEMSNHPEVVRRLGIIAINTALEVDIYGNVNSTHVNGTHMMNGIGGSGDFARNAYLSIFVTKSLAKQGAISSIVPMVSHVDHTEHDVDIIVTECGLADLRELAPRERARAIIDNCVHPLYRDQSGDYFKRACQRGGHTPHLLEEAFSWHQRRLDTGTMLRQS
ncbi:MAG: acetyl-CoA hydrolase/transferase family protein [Candidatus Devosia phytovorans]|uniref:Acetyl-CoA hydrolase/transferase family protein n=1 Tax=Candidatus Devosia phytovorans TaxID=3121372 RepID=A0AAJ5VZC2_9HYPH|nr:acetyl-CoA hydrolase/transferase family protein [Devosia sp.]WEK06660.1 MAG: acetyl-CoA hydrolase/transferase family protein [Devosia sp.]